ncbi:hypothetical protein BOTCAL_0001g00440 [Botryotinia calthae]|uniref:Insecticidal crystal toxin domain-containing protein n=1 Tax=Botryotinia calthae TaxID=38488 RepID=A0A4Y8DKB1_9HELO|nr:hypothetical protein BOTCAL_0001g00440 [Botryotinia calthae]
MSNATRDYGDLRVTMTSAFNWVWNDKGSGATKNFEAYHPVSQGDLRPLGSLGFSSYNERNGKFAALLVGKNPSSSGTAAVASPTGYDLIWRDEKSGGDHDGSFWRPRAPSGYVSLGDVCSGSWNAPSNDKIWCVRADLVQNSNHFKAKVWDDQKSVLTLPNPKRFTEFTAPPPEFTKTNIPKGGDIFNHTAQCEVTLPFTVYFPPSDAASLRSINYPFCQLTRKIAWYVHTAHTNNSGGQISDSTTVTKGVSKTLSEEMSHSAGVSVSASYGIKGFGMDVSLNYQFTSTTSSSFTEYEENSRTQGYTVPPYEATIFLSKRIWIQATRADGSVVLKEINFNANDDIHLVGVSLK